MESFKFERKTNLPLLHIKIPVGSVSHITVRSAIKLFQLIKSRFEGRFEVIATPSDIEIEMERPEIVVLNINSEADIESVIKKLDELGGMENDQSNDGAPVDGCKKGTGKNGDSI